MTVRTLCWLNTRSTATASGRCSAIQASTARSMASSRAPMSSSGGVRDHADVDERQRAARGALDHAEAAAGQAGVDPEHPHVAPPLWSEHMFGTNVPATQPTTRQRRTARPFRRVPPATYPDVACVNEG